MGIKRVAAIVALTTYKSLTILLWHFGIYRKHMAILPSSISTSIVFTLFFFFVLSVWQMIRQWFCAFFFFCAVRFASLFVNMGLFTQLVPPPSVSPPAARHFSFDWNDNIQSELWSNLSFWLSLKQKLSVTYARWLVCVPSLVFCFWNVMFDLAVLPSKRTKKKLNAAYACFSAFFFFFLHTQICLKNKELNNDYGPMRHQKLLWQTKFQTNLSHIDHLVATSHLRFSDHQTKKFWISMKLDLLLAIRSSPFVHWFPGVTYVYLAWRRSECSRWKRIHCGEYKSMARTWFCSRADVVSWTHWTGIPRIKKIVISTVRFE